jgi:hypothetical protein
LVQISSKKTHLLLLNLWIPSISILIQDDRDSDAKPAFGTP